MSYIYVTQNDGLPGLVQIGTTDDDPRRAGRHVGLVAAESGYVSLAEDSPIRSAIEAGIPGKKSGPPEDLVGTLLLLCSKAGDWINGQSISVDGGWVMRL